ncbi:hypothetical protein F4553_005960 [Allocatelliglobosispora scoriae]|uniref:YncE family protein n=1 Tax=Allocatelliglobosispora scoriae TaxID=643052 RepID=A0A841BY98_9ACTN|nr:hypothetical protein [Allocatelliglobosispora scoriae]MBB5872526.1 hypothetical protein [Allocatelliglobosispora scoriae]
MANTPGAPALSRRTLLTLLAGTGAAALVGCDPSGNPAAGATSLPDALLVEVEDGTGILRGADRQVIPRSAVTHDGLAIYATSPAGDDTAFWRVDTATGKTSAPIQLPGRWVPQAVSGEGSRVALTQVAVDVTGKLPAGRETTPVLIADLDGVRTELQLRGNFVPETFTEDLTGLFVLEWLPAAAPDHYRVRLVDLASKQPGPLLTRDKVPVPAGAEEEMRGEGRQAVLAPDRMTLYTLYTHQPGHAHTRDLLSGRPGNAHAFVHTLNLVARWAFCIDLPHPFGEGAPSGHSMAITPNGAKLYVADAASGGLAEIYTENQTVGRTAALGKATGTGAAATDGSRLLLGAGKSVRVVDLTRWAVAAEWPVDEEITGLVLSPDAKRVYVGQTGAVSWHDPATGAEQGRIAVPGLTTLKGLAGHRA